MAEMMDMGTRQTEEQTQQGDEAISSEMMEAMMEGMPLRQMLSFVPGVTKETLNALLAALNG